jgi:hypothetical protein
MKKLAIAVVAAVVGAIGGYAVGLKCRCSKDIMVAPPAASSNDKSAKELDAARKKIAELEKSLASVRKRAKKAEALAKKAKEASAISADGESEKKIEISVGVNEDLMARLKENFSDEELAEATNAMSRLGAKLSERAKNKIGYLESIDVSRLSESERKTHAEFIRLSKKREKINAKIVKNGMPDMGSIQEMAMLEVQLQPLAAEERSILAKEVARDLGYSGEDVEVVHDAIKQVYDCTSNGLGDMIEGTLDMSGVEMIGP